MIAVITGDIIASRKLPQRALWLKQLKDLLRKKSDFIKVSRWEIYRGDSFQLELGNPSMALLTAFLIRSSLKAIPAFHQRKLDVRMAIGIGKKGYKGKNVNESDGQAYQFSGLLLDEIQDQEIKLALRSPWPLLDDEMNVSLQLASVIMDGWTQVSAETTRLLWLHENTQQKLARKLKVSQPAIHKRITKSHFNELNLLRLRFETQVKKLA